MEPTNEPAAPQTPVPMRGMSKKKILTIVIPLLVLIALFVLNAQKAEVPVPASNENAVTLGTPTPEATKGQTSLAELLAKNLPQECTFTATNDGVTTAGSVYLADGNMRVNSNVTMADGTVNESSLLSDGTTMYVWGTAMEQGIKMNMADVQAQGTTPAGQTSQVDLERTGEYDCVVRTPDPSVFVLPADVTFVDMSAVLQALPAGQKGGVEDTAASAPEETDYKAIQCAACAQAEGFEADCRKALNCDE